MINVKYLVRGIAMHTYIKTTFIFFLIAVTSVIIFIPSRTEAAAFSSRATGDWSASATWTLTSGSDADGVPDADDDVTLVGGYNVTVSGNAACTSITFSTNSGARILTVNAGVTLAVSGSITINAPGNTNTSALTINGTVTVGGYVSLVRNGTSNTRIAQININNAAALLDIAGDLSYTSGNNARTVIIFNAAGNITIGGNLSESSTYGTLTPGSGTITFDGTGAQSVGLQGAMTFNNLVVNKASGTLTATTNITVGANLTITSGTFDIVTYTCNRSATGGTASLSAPQENLLSEVIPAE